MLNGKEREIPQCYKNQEQTPHFQHVLHGFAWWQMDNSGIAQVPTCVLTTFCREQTLCLPEGAPLGAQHLPTAPPHRYFPAISKPILSPLQMPGNSPQRRYARCLVGICFPHETTIIILIQVYPPATDRSKIKEFKSKPEKSSFSPHG